MGKVMLQELYPPFYGQVGALLNGVVFFALYAGAYTASQGHNGLYVADMV